MKFQLQVLSSSPRGLDSSWDLDADQRELPLLAELAQVKLLFTGWVSNLLSQHFPCNLNINLKMVVCYIHLCLQRLRSILCLLFSKYS